MKQTFILFFFFLLSACSSRPPFITVTDLKAVPNLADKEALYAEVRQKQARLPQGQSLSKEEQGLMAMLSRDISAELSERIETLIKDKKNDQEFISLSQLAEARKINQRLSLHQVEQAKAFGQRIAEQYKTTESFIASVLETPIPELNEENATALLRAQTLSHNSSKYHTPLTSRVSELRLNNLLNAQQAYESHDFNSARIYIDKALLLGADKEAETLRLQIMAKDIDTQLKRRLKTEEPAAVFEYLVELASDDQFLVLAPFLDESLQNLNTALTEQAKIALSENDYLAAYAQLKRIKQVKTWRAEEAQTFNPAISMFLERINDAAKRAAQKNRSGLEYGLLLSMSSLDPSYPELDQTLRFSEKRLLSQASVRVAVLPFKNVDAHESVGIDFSKRIVEKLNLRLKEKHFVVIYVADPDDVERSQYRIRYLLLGTIQSAKLRYSTLASKETLNIPGALVQATSELAVSFELHDRQGQVVLVSNALTAKSQAKTTEQTALKNEDFELLLNELVNAIVDQVDGKLAAPTGDIKALAEQRLTEEKFLDAIEVLAPLLLISSNDDQEQQRQQLIKLSLEQANILGLR